MRIYLSHAAIILLTASYSIAADKPLHFTGKAASSATLKSINGNQDRIEEQEKKKALSGMLKNGTPISASKGGGVGFTQRSIANNHISGNDFKPIPSPSGNVSAAFGANQVNYNSIRYGVVDSFVSPNPVIRH